VGDNPASATYVRAKQRACEKAGIASRDIRLPESVSEAELLETVAGLNADEAVDGILVQLPLPRQIDDRRVIMSINPDKDVDGFHPVNLGRLLAGEDAFFPCTPYGILVMLERSGIDVEGRHVVVVGRSNIVGKPLAALLMQKRGGERNGHGLSQPHRRSRRAHAPRGYPRGGGRQAGDDHCRHGRRGSRRRGRGDKPRG
jgi:methylenetetrahydrofolate dehydrogenase (NADP+)/methenyltetrahydrofolate cyclohydrolase